MLWSIAVVVGFWNVFNFNFGASKVEWMKKYLMQPIK
jgi:hypothetical protein